jgi:hypothetical protein
MQPSQSLPLIVMSWRPEERNRTSSAGNVSGRILRVTNRLRIDLPEQGKASTRARSISMDKDQSMYSLPFRKTGNLTGRRGGV